MTAVDTADELAMVRDTAAAIARRCRDTAGDDHAACWAALREAGLSELRDADGGAPAGSVAMAAAVVEELAGAVCGAPLVGHLVAAEALRRADAGPVPDDTLTFVVDHRWRAPAPDGVAVDAAFASRAVAIDPAGAVSVVRLGEPVAGVDATRPTRPADAASDRVGTLPDAEAVIAFARTLLAADALGAASAVLDAAVAYAKEREQFGVPIGSFQAVQHLCAQAHVQVEAMRSALLFAVRALDTGAAATRTSLVAKAYASDAAVEVAEAAVQVFGGIAITVEHSAHRHLRRVLVDRELLGDADALTDLLLDEVDA